MALKIVLVVLIGWIGYLLIFDSGPALNGFETCALRTKSNFNRLGSEGASRGISSERLCQLRREQLIYDQACLENVKKQHITGSMLFWISQSRPKVNSVIREHNQFCVDYRLPVYEVELADPTIY